MIIIKKDRVILHSDLNSFYASVECFFNPELKNVPMAVAGNQENRQGVILAKNEIAKKFGVLTGEASSMAKRKCPNLVLVPPSFEKYIEYSRMVRQIYTRYTDQIESFGIDECWLDVTGSQLLFGTGEEIAEKIRKEVREEIGITVSIGVSFNKIFAKLGSDYKKPDAITAITRENYKNIIWNLQVDKLLYVGKKTSEKMRSFGIFTIGDLANTNEEFLTAQFGQWGKIFYINANGNNNEKVANIKDDIDVKSVSNGTTTAVDLKNSEEVKATVYMLSDSVATRLRDLKLKCTTIQISFTTNDFENFTRQMPTLSPTYVSKNIADIAMELFESKYDFKKPIRQLAVKATNLVPKDEISQLDFFQDIKEIEKAEDIEEVVDEIRKKFGHLSIQKGIVMAEETMKKKNPNKNHLIHPNSYFK